MTEHSKEKKLFRRFHLFAVENRLECYIYVTHLHCVFSNEFSTSLDCFRRVSNALRNLLTRRVIYRRETFRVTEGMDSSGFAQFQVQFI